MAPLRNPCHLKRSETGHVLLILIPLAWLAVATLVAAACQVSAQADEVGRGEPPMRHEARLRGSGELDARTIGVALAETAGRRD